MNGKGDKPRPTDLTRYGAGWDRVFGSNPNKDISPDKKCRYDGCNENVWLYDLCRDHLVKDWS